MGVTKNIKENFNEIESGCHNEVENVAAKPG